ncbi:CCA tRNA nucleotidyltransferase [Bdellovibrio bacteriovorus]|uniref:CCA tRNA nucleotidyltransferase n=1 Tax=Bdellovibrio bacteriovorus TaxID=959 RepID=UPI0035A6293F
MSQVQKLLESHPHWAAVEAIYHRLQAHGYKAFLAGGCVRDALLGIQANDLDLATDATPDQIESLFEKTVNVGKVFGVMRVLVEGADIEVATFRTDMDYKDGRRPEGVEFSSPQEDAQRRDFTVNALFYDLVSKDVLDYVHGQEDLAARILRTVGEPEKRFQEDHLRLLRAARFSAQLDFDIEERSFAAVSKMASLVKRVSGERIRDEMAKLLKAKALRRGLDIMSMSGLMKELFPFRERDNSWIDHPAVEAWQNFSLFFAKAEKSELEQGLKLLRLSVKEMRAIERAWTLWKSPEDFFKQSMGQRLQRLQEDGVLYALQILLRQNTLWKLEIEELFAEWSFWQQQLPKPFLNGEDIKGQLSGKAIGECLALAYEQQLERKLRSRDEALQWLQKYLEREPS